MRAAIYCRISRDKTGEAAGVTRQLEDCRELATAIGWDVVEVYTDNDISATSGKVRPAYRKMLADLEGGQIGGIIAWHPDRMYRKFPDLIPLIDACQRNNVQIATVKAGNIDLTTATGRMLANILASVSTAEGELKSERWRRSVRQRRESGEMPKSGPRLFGYTREGEQEPTEAALVVWLAESAIEGESLNALAAKLNTMGVTTTLGNEWGRTSVRQLLTNGRLAGWSMLNGDRVGVGQWDAILSEETFEQVQAALAVRRRASGRKPRVALLVGLAKCSECEGNLVTARRGKRGDNGSVRIYKCRKEPGGKGCGKVSIQAEPVEQIAEAYTQAKLEDPEFIAILNGLAADSGDKITEVLALEDRLTELEAQLDQPGIPVAAITRAMDRTKERIESLRSEATFTPTALPVRGEWPEDLHRRAALVRLAIAEVVCSPATRGGNKFDNERVNVVPTRNL
jgi:site-specific DNA recombinase